MGRPSFICIDVLMPRSPARNLMEAYYLQRNRAGLRGIRTSMQMKDGLDDDLWEMTGQQETVRGPRLWEDSMTMWRRGARRCTYKKRLAEVGLVWWSDVTNEKGDGWMTWSEASSRASTTLAILQVDLCPVMQQQLDH